MNTHRIGFDREKYLALQSHHIDARRNQFGGKLYHELGGKRFDDMHASRVLPASPRTTRTRCGRRSRANSRSSSSSVPATWHKTRCGRGIFRNLGVQVTREPVHQAKNLYRKR